MQVGTKMVHGGENPLKCITQDEKDLVFNKVFFPYILIPMNISEPKNVKYFTIQYFRPSQF
jgi:hypothetical protein